VWLARPASATHERDLAARMAAARAAEYAAVTAQAEAALTAGDRGAVSRRLRAELHRITRRDFFPPPEREAAVRAVDALVAATEPAAPEAS